VISLPARTESGVDAVLRTRLAGDVELVTVSFAIAELAPEVWLAAFTVAVLEMTVPTVVPVFTV
jgi:hypothetical protein